VNDLRIDSTVGTHVGRVRTNNEDAFCDGPDMRLWAVADGMGGHENGEWASAAIVATLGKLPVPDDFDAACHAIADAIHRANDEVYTEATSRDIQMGSTVVALHVTGRRFCILWVGDSRAYLLRAGQLYQISKDHTQVQEMVDRGLMRPEDAEGHPMSHVLARAVGVQAEVEVDAITDEAEPGDVFLLCSDGLTGQVTDAEIAEVLSTTPNHAEAREKLTQMTLDRGAPDNVTIAIVGLNETTILSLNTPIGSTLS
jgi:serine/threonine protein phosphatase PrpC